MSHHTLNKMVTRTSPHAFTRRTALRAALGGGLMVAGVPLVRGQQETLFGGSTAFAQFGNSPQITSVGQPLKDRYFVLCMFDGGWDTLLSLDPRDPRLFTDQAAVDTQITLGYNRLSDIPTLGLPNYQGVYLPNRITLAGSGSSSALGAYLGDLATPAYSGEIAIVRGVNMSTLAHDVGRVRARTGRPPSGNQPRGSSIATWLARHYSRGELIPNLSIGEEVYNLDLPLDYDIFEVNTPIELRNALTPSTANAQLQNGTLASVEALLDNAYPCSDGSSPWMSEARLSVERARQLLALRLGERLDLAAENEEMSGLRSRFGFDTSSTSLRSPAAKAALASLAITTGLSRVVSVRLVGGLDTHYGYGDGQNWLRHGIRQYEGWQAIARLIDELRQVPVPDGSGESYYDRTTIVAYSDFGRTAMLNPAGGRDHWLTSAYLLAGADIAGGTVVGASSDVGMTPTLINPNTGVSSATQGVEIRPAHIWQTLLYSAGFDMQIDPADLRVPPLLPLLSGAV